MSKASATNFQLEALRAAAPSGRLRMLPGGFWVAGDYPEVPRNHIPPQWLSTTTVRACERRGWFVMPNYYTALLTETGRKVMAEMAEVRTDVPEGSRLAREP